MPKKILSVDDSKTVRLIVRKALKPFDVAVCEAQNGEEGLVVARAEKPDLILLDVTMPVLDGVEMLARLKADPELKKIPVVMLTAEAGREKVLTVAKIGACGYIVKPFTEQVLIEKLTQILPLKPARGSGDRKLVILVEDKLPVVRQVFDAVHEPGWTWKHLASPEEALEFADQQSVDAVVINLSLPDDGAVGLLRDFRLRENLAATPFIGLVLKTADDLKAQALAAGFAALVDKPINPRELEEKLRQALQSDATSQDVEFGEAHLIIRPRDAMTAPQFEGMLLRLGAKAPQAVDSGLSLAVFDLLAVKTFTADLAAFLEQGTKCCEALGMRCLFLGDSALAAGSRAFEATKDCQFYESLALALTQDVPGAV